MGYILSNCFLTRDFDQRVTDGRHYTSWHPNYFSDHTRWSLKKPTVTSVFLNTWNRKENNSCCWHATVIYTAWQELNLHVRRLPCVSRPTQGILLICRPLLQHILSSCTRINSSQILKDIISYLFIHESTI